MPTNNDERLLVACAFWLHAGLAFASLAAGGVLLLFSGETTLLNAAALIALGIVLGVASWRRSRAIIERPEASVGAASSLDAARRPYDGYTMP
jgi:hypothetical protein